MRVSFPSIANAGAIDNIPILYSIYHGIEEETNNYTVAWQPGKLTIEPRRFTLTTASATKEYDDTPLVEHGVTISGDELAKGHVYHRYADTDPINAGKYENKTSIRIFDKSDVDVTDLGYEIQYPISNMSTVYLRSRLARLRSGRTVLPRHIAGSRSSARN